MIADIGQVCLFNVANGKLVWRVALPEFTVKEPGPDRLGLFEPAVPIVVSGDTLITQYGGDEVAALSLRTGDLIWVSAQIGISDAGLRPNGWFAWSNARNVLVEKVPPSRCRRSHRALWKKGWPATE